MAVYTKINQKEINEINRLYFDNRVQNSFENINLKIQNYANKNNISYLEKQKFLCNKMKKICYSITKNGKKIF